MKKEKAEVTLTHQQLTDRLLKAEANIDELKDRCHQLERVVRIVGTTFQQNHLSEDAARKHARHMRSLSNAMREVKGHIKRFGNEFDREPHMENIE
jgi:hypothetical protein